MKKRAKTLLNILKVLLSDPGKLRLLADKEKEYLKWIRKFHPGFSSGLPVIELSAICNAELEPVNPYSFLGGNSLISDLSLLSSLARQSAKCNYFEIGTWRGESVANVARFADTCYTLNLPDQQMEEMGYSSD